MWTQAGLEHQENTRKQKKWWKMHRQSFRFLPFMKQTDKFYLTVYSVGYGSSQCPVVFLNDLFWWINSPHPKIFTLRQYFSTQMIKWLSLIAKILKDLKHLTWNQEKFESIPQSSTLVFTLIATNPDAKTIWLNNLQAHLLILCTAKTVW